MRISQRLSSTISLLGFLTSNQVAAFGSGQHLTAPLPSMHRTPAVHSTPTNYNLSSPNRNINANTGSGAVNIIVGGAPVAVNTGMRITAAESVALNQVLQTGHQQLLVNNAGRAVGGTFVLPSSSSLSQLAIPHAVSGVIDFAQNRSLNISGALNNFGNLYAATRDSNVTKAVFNAASITNNSGALITSIVPAGGIGAYQPSNHPLDLQLNSASSILNHGTISSGGSLTMSAKTITNNLPQTSDAGALASTFATSPANANQAVPTITAVGDLNLQTSSLVNSGLLESQSGNINIAQNSSQNVFVNNTGGTIEASKGNINVREASFTGPTATTLIGGNWVSQNVNIYGGSGTVNVNVNSLSGILNASAQAMHTTVTEGTLSLGKICLDGDPTFYDINGSIVLTSQMVLTTNGAALAIVAGGDITTDPNSSTPITIDTSGPNGGGDILMVAGVNIATADSSTSNWNSPGADGSGAPVITLNGPTTNGGSINLTQGGGVSTFTSRGTAGDASGGNISLVAYAGLSPTPTSGSIYLPTTLTVTSGGSGTGNNGDVRIIGGSSNASTTAIVMGNVDATGGSGSGGAVIVISATPQMYTVQTIDGLPLGTPQNSLTIGTDSKLIGTDLQPGIFSSYVFNNDDRNFNATLFEGRPLGDDLDPSLLSSTSVLAGEISSSGKTGTAILTGGEIYLNSATHYLFNSSQFTSTSSAIYIVGSRIELNGGADAGSGTVEIQAGKGGLISHDNISAAVINLAASGPGNIQLTGGITASAQAGLLGSSGDIRVFLDSGSLSSSAPLYGRNVTVYSAHGDIGSALTPLTLATIQVILSAPEGSIHVQNLESDPTKGLLLFDFHASPSSSAVVSIDNYNGDLTLGEYLPGSTLVLNGQGTGIMPQTQIFLTTHGSGNIKGAELFPGSSGVDANVDSVLGGTITFTADSGDIGRPKTDVRDVSTYVHVPVGAVINANTTGNINIALDRVQNLSEVPAILGNISAGDGKTININGFYFKDIIGNQNSHISHDVHDVTLQSGSTMSVGDGGTISIISAGTVAISGQITGGSDVSATLHAENGSVIINSISGQSTVDLAGSNATLTITSPSGSINLNGKISMPDGQISASASSSVIVSSTLLASNVSLTATDSSVGNVYVQSTGVIQTSHNDNLIALNANSIVNEGKILALGFNNGGIYLNDMGGALTVGTGANTHNPAFSTNASGGGIFISSMSGDLTLTGTSQIYDGDLTATTVSGANLIIPHGTTVYDTNSITFKTSNLQLNGTASSQTFVGVSGYSGLTISGNGALDSNNGVTISQNSGDIQFIGNLSTMGPLFISAMNGAVKVNSGATISNIVNDANFGTLAVSSPSGNLVIDGNGGGGKFAAVGDMKFFTLQGHTLTFQNGSTTMLTDEVDIAASSVAFNTPVLYSNSAFLFASGVVGATNLKGLPGSSGSQKSGFTVQDGTLSSIFISTAKLVNSGTIQVVDASSVVAPTIPGLNLADSATVAQLVALQHGNAPGVSGSLTVSNGKVTGGSITLSSAIDLSNLTGLYIPANVTVNLAGFSATNPINIHLSTTAAQNIVEIAGSLNFTGTGSDAHLAITYPSGQTVIGNAFILDTSSKTTSSGSLSITVDGDMNLRGPITAATGLSLTSDAGAFGIIVGAPIKVTAGALSIVSPFNVSQNGSTALLSATSISITATSGSILGFPAPKTTAPLPVTISTTRLTFTAASDAQFSNSSTSGLPVRVSGSAANVVFTSNTTIDVNAAIVAQNVTISSTGSKTGITLEGDIGTTNSGGGLVKITSLNGALIQTAGKLIGDGFILSAGSGLIGTSTSHIFTDASAATNSSATTPSLTVSGTGDAFISNTGAIKLTAPTSPITLDSLEVDQSAGDLTIVGSLSATHFTLQTAASDNSNILIGGTLSTGAGTAANPGSVSLATHGSGSLSYIAPVLIKTQSMIASPVVSLTTGSSDIGTLANPFSASNASGVKFSLNTGANAYVSNSSSTTLGSSNLSALVLTSGGAVNVTGAVSATGNISVTTNNTTGNISLSSGGSLSANNVDLEIQKTGSISTQGNSQITGTTSVMLGVTSGSIGTKTATSSAPVNVSTATLTASTQISGGSVLINNNGSSPVSLAIGSANTSYGVTTGGPLTISGFVFVNTNGSITLQGSQVTLSGNVSSSGPNGVISVNATNGGIVANSGGSLSANTINLSTNPGDIGSSLSALTTFTNNLSVNARGANQTGVYVHNTAAPSGTALNLKSVSTGILDTFSVSNDSAIIYNGASNEPVHSLTLTSSSGGISFTGTTLATNLTLNVSGQNQISQAAKSTIIAGNTSLNIDAGSANLGAGGTTSGFFATNSLSITAGTGNVTVVATSPVSLNSATMTGNLSLTAASVTVPSSTTLSLGTVTINTPSFNNSGTINASSNFTVLSHNGLTLSGTGSITSGAAIAFTATVGDVSMQNANQELTGGATFSAPAGSVFADATTTIHGSNDVTIVAGSLFNPDAFSSDSQLTFTIGAPGVSLGTISNTGNINLTSNVVVNSTGKSLAVVSGGNIIASGITAINLNSTTSNGGDLTLLAGFDFSTVSGSLTANQLLTIVPSSTKSGNINLSNVNINTSTTSTNIVQNGGGNVTLVANGGTIITGSINTNSTTGTAGNVTLLAPDGVFVNSTAGVTATGANGGGSIVIGAATISATGNPALSDGVLKVGAAYIPISTNLVSGAPVVVAGPLKTGSTASAGGSVAIIADGKIATGAISTGGAAFSGSVSLQSISGSVIVAGDINTAGLPVTVATSLASGGKGGAVNISVPTSATISGNIISSGGSAAGAGNGGNAGMITIATQARGANAVYGGDISIGGYINASGGAGKATAGGAAGGNGAAVTLTSGALQVFAVSSGNSINAGGGKAKAGAGSDGQVTIDTYATQQLPANFNLLSATASEAVLPGGLFTVGTPASIKSPLINGTAGAIAGLSGTLSKSNAADVTSSQAASAGLNTITVHGGSTAISVDNVNFTPYSGNFVRNLATPAQAVALYQISLGSGATSQTLGVSGGKATGINPQTGNSASLITVPNYDLPAAFSAFNLSTADSGNHVTLHVDGSNAYLNLANVAAPVIAGTLEFAGTGAAVINVGKTALNIPSSGIINTAGDLALVGAAANNWTNNGTLSVGNLVLVAPGGTMNFTNTGSIQTISTVIIPTLVPSTTVSITNHSDNFSSAIALVDYTVPGIAGAAFATAGAAKVGTAGLTLNLLKTNSLGVEQTVSVTGQSSSLGALTINGVSNAKLGTTQPFEIASSAHISAGTISLNSGNTITLKNTTPMQAAKTVTINGASVDLEQGNLATLAGDIKISATAGDVTFGNGNVLVAHGGSLFVAATGNINGANGLSNSFSAYGNGAAKNPVGGAIEFSAGAQKSQLTAALSKPAGTRPTDLSTLASDSSHLSPITGNGRLIINNDKLGTGVVDVTFNSAGTASFTLNGGAVVFDVGNGKNIELEGGTFVTSTLAPIGYSASAEMASAISRKDSGTETFARILVEGAQTSTPLSAGSNDDGKPVMNVERGDIFLQALKDMEVNSKFGKILVKKGGMLSLSLSGAALRVVSCSAPGAIQLKIANRVISLGAGEEIAISNQKSLNEQNAASDGLARRGVENFVLTNGLHMSTAEVSLFSLLSKAKHVEGLRHAMPGSDKVALFKVLKLAAAIQQATQRRGQYFANPQQNQNEQSDRTVTKVLASSI